MARRPRVAVIGDYAEGNPTHRATTAELAAAGAAVEWVPTPAVGHAERALGGFDGLWISPGSPYASMDGALAAIRYGRERGVPLVGT
jgi:CTP synthase (UTP-ammonia lyase)